MEERISFEHFLFGDGMEITISDMEFCVDRVIMLPKIRPHQLERAVRLSIEYCQNDDFRRKVLEKSNECPFLVYQLFKKGVFEFEEMKPFLNSCDSLLLCYYFWKEIENFEMFIRYKNIPERYDTSFFNNSNDYDQMIEYGFVPSSIEYCLKYDAIEDLHNWSIISNESKWSPFEWSYKPDNLSTLSLSGLFGSIKCFKYLLMKGFEISEQVIHMIVCSGCVDLLHLCQTYRFITIECICKASEFYQISLLDFMIENGVDLNRDSVFVLILFLIIILFMEQQNLVILE